MTIQAGGRATFQGNYGVGSNTTTEVTGGGSRLETLSGGLSISSGSEVHIESGGTYSGASLTIGQSGLGTLNVDGFASSVSTSNVSTWGSMGGKANVTFSNHASGALTGGLDLAADAAPGSTAVVKVESGADLTIGSLSLAAAGGATTSAKLDVQGSGSTVAQAGSSLLTIGHTSFGTAELNVGTIDSGASFSTGSGQILIHPTGQLSVGSATSSGSFLANGNFTLSGRLNRGAGSTFTIAAGRSLTIQNGGRATFEGSYSLNVGTSVGGTGSRLDVAADLSVSGNNLSVSAGGAVSAGESLDVGGNTPSGFSVSGLRLCLKTDI
jgi:hypothetical protein